MKLIFMIIATVAAGLFVFKALTDGEDLALVLFVNISMGALILARLEELGPKEN